MRSVESVSSKLPRSPPAPSCAGPPPRRPPPLQTQDSPPGARHQGGPVSPDQKLREDRVQPCLRHRITYLK